ncbi:MAG: glycosyltransferase [Nostoc sp.]|uniref:glycosyltransferase n=1 Tax=Nostoc sp. TaxID=1180 RepID=UPI002FF5DF54
MGVFVLGLMLLSLTIWLGLLCFWGQFWRTDQQLEVETLYTTSLQSLPVVCAVVPARNEAQLLPTTLRSLLLQDYPGSFNVFLVDDRSTDQTANFAKGVAHAVGKPQQLHIISGVSLPPGWSGKLWAVEQGINNASKFAPDYFLLTDADIEHDPGNLRRLVAKAVQEDLDLVSVMVRLRCESFWEKLLIPAFVFFFQKLYPFRWVNNPNNPTAAAAGGSILIAREALERIGGIQVIRQALIDDCTLAQAVKRGTGNTSLPKAAPMTSSLPCGTLRVACLRAGVRQDQGGPVHRWGHFSTRGCANDKLPSLRDAMRSLLKSRGTTSLGRPSASLGTREEFSQSPLTLSEAEGMPNPHAPNPHWASPRFAKVGAPSSPIRSQGRIWLGLSNLTQSVRPYDSLATVWDMVARTAYTQLNYSPLLLLGTLVGMALIYLIPPVCVILGAVWSNWAIAFTGLLGWLLMTFAYYPIIRFYKCSLWFAFSLPAIAFLYTLMTLDSALRHWQGRGGAWKGRVYPNS